MVVSSFGRAVCSVVRSAQTSGLLGSPVVHRRRAQGDLSVCDTPASRQLSLTLPRPLRPSLRRKGRGGSFWLWQGGSKFEPPFCMRLWSGCGAVRHRSKQDRDRLVVLLSHTAQNVIGVARSAPGEESGQRPTASTWIDSPECLCYNSKWRLYVIGFIPQASAALEGRRSAAAV